MTVIAELKIPDTFHVAHLCLCPLSCFRMYIAVLSSVAPSNARDEADPIHKLILFQRPTRKLTSAFACCRAQRGTPGPGMLVTAAPPQVMIGVFSDAAAGLSWLLLIDKRVENGKWVSLSPSADSNASCVSRRGRLSLLVSRASSSGFLRGFEDGHRFHVV